MVLFGMGLIWEAVRFLGCRWVELAGGVDVQGFESLTPHEAELAMFQTAVAVVVHHRSTILVLQQLQELTSADVIGPFSPQKQIQVCHQ